VTRRHGLRNPKPQTLNASWQAFLERELRAKERAEHALKQLQKEKAARLKALQEQRDLRAKRMSNLQKGDPGVMNDWQVSAPNSKLQNPKPQTPNPGGRERLADKRRSWMGFRVWSLGPRA
jgi:hypothetical protein